MLQVNPSFRVTSRLLNGLQRHAAVDVWSPRDNAGECKEIVCTSKNAALSRVNAVAGYQLQTGWRCLVCQ
jgi:hypothetical protein